MNDYEERTDEGQGHLRRLWWLVLKALIAALEQDTVQAKYLALSLMFLKHNNIKAQTASAHGVRGGLEKLHAAMLENFGPPEKKQ
jgi:hypothetical protein